MMTLNYEQFKKLEGVWFWLREVKFLVSKVSEQKHIDAAHDAVKVRIEECDSLNIPFIVQNKVLCHEDVYDDIRDILTLNEIKYKVS